MRHLLCVLLLSGLACLGAESSDALAEFSQAMSGQDATAKKAALQRLGDKSVAPDDVVLPLLIQALGDRQVSDVALSVLQARTGLQPPSNKRLGGPGYPGYPKDDSQASWSGWLSERNKALEQERLLKELKEKEKKPSPPPSGNEASPAEGEVPVVEARPEAPTVDPDLGTLDRVIFKTGAALRCYVLNKRLDADGNLVSIRIVHPEGGGEEVLQAELISRIEEDVK
jgi:hypothetical protein